jgi:hypothetical protein
MEANLHEVETYVNAVMPRDVFENSCLVTKELETAGEARKISCINDFKHVLTRNLTYKTTTAITTAPRRKDFQVLNNSQGGKRDVLLVNSLKLDVDGFKPLNGGPKLALEDDHKERIRRMLLDSDYVPSIIIDSGGGIHAYWTFDTPIYIADIEIAKRIESVNKQLFLYFKSLQLPGVVDSSVCDISRLLRLPGTYNYRYGAPRLVKILEVVK